jgi:hypothetical protein
MPILAAFATCCASPASGAASTLTVLTMKVRRLMDG